MSTQINRTMKTYGDNLSFLLSSIHISFNILYLSVYALLPKINLDSFSRLDHGFAYFMLLWGFRLVCFITSKETDLDAKIEEGSHI